MKFVILKEGNTIPTSCIGPFKTEKEAKAFIEKDSKAEKAEYETHSEIIPDSIINEEWSPFYGEVKFTQDIFDSFINIRRVIVWEVTELTTPKI